VAGLVLLAAGATGAALVVLPAPPDRLTSSERGRLESAVLAREPGGAIAGETCGVATCRISVQTAEWTRCDAWSAAVTPRGVVVSRLGRC
jgi:hypothetical protein